VVKGGVTRLDEERITAGRTGTAGGLTFPSGQWAPSARIFLADGSLLAYFRPHQARSRAYRWGDDGINGHQSPPVNAGCALPCPCGRERSAPHGNPRSADGPRQPGRDVKENYYLPRTSTADAFVHEGACTSTVNNPYHRHLCEETNEPSGARRIRSSSFDDTAGFDQRKYFVRSRLRGIRQVTENDILSRVTGRDP